MWYVYILKSRIKKWHYVGSTNNLNRRVNEHNSGLVRSTKPYFPLDLVYKIEFGTEDEARKFEKKLKKQRIAKEEILREIF